MKVLSALLAAGWIDNLFDDCVLFIKDFGAAFGMTYNEANIFLFVFLMPVLILFFMALSVINLYVNKKPKTQKVMKYVTLLSVFITIVLPFVVLLLVIMNVALDQVPLQPPH